MALALGVGVFAVSPVHLFVLFVDPFAVVLFDGIGSGAGVGHCWLGMFVVWLVGVLVGVRLFVVFGAVVVRSSCLLALVVALDGVGTGVGVGKLGCWWCWCVRRWGGVRVFVGLVGVGLVLVLAGSSVNMLALVLVSLGLFVVVLDSVFPRSYYSSRSVVGLVRGGARAGGVRRWSCAGAARAGAIGAVRAGGVGTAWR